MSRKDSLVLAERRHGRRNRIAGRRELLICKNGILNDLKILPIVRESAAASDLRAVVDVKDPWVACDGVIRIVSQAGTGPNVQDVRARAEISKYFGMTCVTPYPRRIYLCRNGPGHAVQYGKQRLEQSLCFGVIDLNA